MRDDEGEEGFQRPHGARRGRVLVATVPDLPGCHTQARSLDELERRVREAVFLYLEASSEEIPPELEFVGLQRIAVDLP